MDDTEFQRYCNGVLEVGVARETLKKLYRLCKPYQRVGLVGFNDYAKHLINVLDGTVQHVIDVSIGKININFRGVPVQPVQQAGEVDAYIVCDFEILEQVFRELYEKGVCPRTPYLFSEQYGYASAVFYDPLIHDPVYRDIMSHQGRPPAMVSENRVSLLLDLLRSTLPLKGAIAEFGAWQGGSAWYMCQLLHVLGDTRKAFIFDLFDEIPRHNGRGIVSAEQVRRALAFYEGAQVIQGDFRATIPKIEGERLSFVHFDSGWIPNLLPIVWDMMLPGAVMLLDNYGHLKSTPAHFNTFFESKGARVVLLPPLGQGIVYKFFEISHAGAE